MGIKKNGLTRPSDIWDRKSLKRHMIWRKMQKKPKNSLFHYCTFSQFPCKNEMPNICS